MPAYSSTTSPNSIAHGESANVWATADGTLASGTKTQRVALVPNHTGASSKLSFRVAFSAAPGAISLQLQAADFDADQSYSSEGSPVTTLNAAGNEARGEFPAVAAKFARILAITVTNAVTAIGDISA
jgi:hypothetical protein